MGALLELHGLDAHYGEFRALSAVSLRVESGEMVALLGANGAGKTTLLRALSGLLPVARDRVLLAGRPIGGLPADEVTRGGIAMVPEGRRLFRSLTVEENLRLGAHAGRRGPWTLDRVFRLFPILAERRGMPATVLSGGEQQMVAMGRALMSNPRLLLCDEVSLGLAPGVVRSLYATLAEVRAEGVGMLVVEQDLGQVLRSAERAYCLRQGRVVLEGAGRELGLDAIRLAYLGA